MYLRLTSLIIAGGFAASHPAAAQGMQGALCGDRESIVTRLHTKYGETRRGMGLGANNGIMEVFASADTGTWTVAVTLPDGRMCLIATGESYEDNVALMPTTSEDA